MPSVTVREATETLIQSVRTMEAADLLDFHNEVFPQSRKSELSPPGSGADDRHKILEYLSRGLEIEEILDFWNVVFPISYNVHFDDEDQKIHFGELSETVRSSD